MSRLYYLFSRTLAILILAAFVGIVVYLVYNGLKELNLSLITNELKAPLIGTICLVLLSVAIALPLGVASAIYIEFYAPKRLQKILDFSFEMLASVPSIVMGLFGFSLLLFLHNIFSEIKSSLALASVSVAFLILPYITKATILGFRDILPHFRLIGYALGANKDALIKKIILPLAKEHITKGALLAVARASEDTAVIMLTGVVASYGIPDGLFKPFEALPFFIYYTSANYSSEAEFNAIFVAILMLLAISFSIMALIRGKIWLR